MGSPSAAPLNNLIMSMVTLQLGQFGNQLGYEFFKTALDDIYCLNGANAIGKKFAITDNARKDHYEDAAFETFFYTPSNLPLARAVMIDTEAKVVDDVFSKVIIRCVCYYYISYCLKFSYSCSLLNSNTVIISNRQCYQ